MQAIEPELQLLTPLEVKNALKTSLSWVYAASKAGVLPSVKIPSLNNGKKSLVRFKMADILALIDKNYS